MAGCGIYLVVEAASGAEARLAVSLGAVEAAAVLIRPRAGDALSPANARALVAAAQAKGAAALLLDDADLARALRADGVHLSPAIDIEARYELAREIIGRRGIVGVDVGRSRHDAMTLAEAGADYVTFSATADGPPGDQAGAIAAPDDLVEWWTEIFEVPCVVFDVASAEVARSAAARGADFVGVPVPADAAAGVVQRRLAEVVQAAAAGRASD